MSHLSCYHHSSAEIKQIDEIILTFKGCIRSAKSALSNVPKQMHKSCPPFNIENQELKVMVNS